MKAQKTLIFILLVIFLLALLCIHFPKKGLYIAGHRFLFPSLEEVLSPKDQSINAREQVKEMEESLRIKLRQDSIAYADSLAYQDSLAFYTDFFTHHPSRIHMPDNNPGYFDSLFITMENCRKNKELIHILHYGDSQIEGDRITGYIRQQLQETFGGKGPGLIPAVQPIPSAAVGQAISDSIPRYIISGSLKQNAGHRRYGALAQMAELWGSVTISVSSRNWANTFENTKEFSKIRLFVGQNDTTFRVALHVPNNRKGSPAYKLESKKGVNIYTWNLPNSIKRFSLNLSGKAEIYGIAADGNDGIAMSNIPLRGSSGTFFTGIDSNTLSAMYEELNTKLIILEFGGNATPVINSDKSVEFYKKSIAEQIQYLSRIYPEAKILLIGPADMSTKIDGKLQTYPYLEKTIEAMREAANEKGAAFWDMYQVMGGKNSMIAWVDNNPAWAAPDYIHFTPKGAEKIAKLFYESLMIYYDYYKFMNRKLVSGEEKI